MAWVKIDDQLFRHPKILAAGRDARDLYLAALCYCNNGLTDGIIAPTALPLVAAEAQVADPTALCARLVAVGLWEELEAGYRVHDYLEYQPSAEQVRAQRAENARRQAEFRERKRARHGVSNGATNAPVTGLSHDPVPVPVPVPVPTPAPVPAPQETARPSERAAQTCVSARRGRASERDAIADGFDVWWRCYPRKIGKGQARQAWRKQHLSDDDVQRLTAAVERQCRSAQWQDEGGRFIPHPATWLNQERWDDEPEILVVAGARASPNGRASPDEKFARSVESLARVTGLKPTGGR